MGFRVGLIGARGYVGSELIRLLSNHSHCQIGFVSSRERVGEKLSDHEADFSGDLHYVAYDPQQVAESDVDVIVLALPNGKAAPFVQAIDQVRPGRLIIDLSADYRFDSHWYYGLPELTYKRYADQRRISNPGCYATAMQLAIAPMQNFLSSAVQCFGVSGYSGAGTTQSDKNDPEKLRDNLMPYALTGHIHEREVSAQLNHPVEFMPHVAPHFRGLTITANLHLSKTHSCDEIIAIYQHYYDDQPLIAISDTPPWVSQIAGRHGAQIGGFVLSEDGRRLVVVSVLDNLLKGAATQALQNINIAMGFDQYTGILQ